MTDRRPRGPRTRWLLRFLVLAVLIGSCLWPGGESRADPIPPGISWRVKVAKVECLDPDIPWEDGEWIRFKIVNRSDRPKDELDIQSNHLFEMFPRDIHATILFRPRRDGSFTLAAGDRVRKKVPIAHGALDYVLEVDAGWAHKRATKPKSAEVVYEEVCGFGPDRVPSSASLAAAPDPGSGDVPLPEPAAAVVADYRETRDRAEARAARIDLLLDINGPWTEPPPPPPPADPGEPARRRLPPRSAEEWRPLVSEFFRPEHVDWALVTLICESGGDPEFRHPRTNKYGRALGLFSQMSKLWPDRAVEAGWAGASPFDPRANVAVAAHLLYRDRDDDGRPDTYHWPYCGSRTPVE